MTMSRAELLADLPRVERRALFTRLGEQYIRTLRASWEFWSRPEQRIPVGDWSTWVVMAGRGYGKTRTGAEFILDRSEEFHRHGVPHRVMLVGATVADCRDVMVEGESGLIACAERRGYKIDYQPSLRRVTIPELDTVMTTFTAEKPDQLRGPQGHTAWADEPAKWKLYVDREGNSAWSNLMLALRLEGDVPSDWSDGYEDDLPEIVPAPPELQPKCVATTTPKPIPLVREWVTRATSGDRSIHLTTGSMMENKSNLASRFMAEVTARYAGTRLAAQEIEGLLLDAVEGALWSPEIFERWRIHRRDAVPDLSRKVVAVDPSGSARGTGDDCGIVVAGVEANPANPIRRHFYVLDDLTTPERPEVWARVAVDAYWREDAAVIVAERNFGGELVRDVIHLTDPSVPVELVNASAGRGKIPRAEPVALLWDQGRGHTVGYFGAMEAECCTYVPNEGLPSPNRMDAMVWAAHWLLPEISTPPAQSTSVAETRMPTGADAMIRNESGGLFGPGQLPPGWS